jgi:hypothetical protein
MTSETVAKLPGRATIRSLRRAAAESLEKTMVSLPSEFSGVVPAEPGLQPQYALRPLSTGEVLDRTFQLYRSKFWLFVGISAIVPAINVVFAIVRQFLIGHHAIGGAAHGARGQVGLVIFDLLMSVTGFVLYGVAHAAAVSAISNVYLGRESSVAGAYRAAKQHWLRYAVVAVAQLWSAGWLPFLLLAAMFSTVPLMRRAGHSGPASTNLLVLVFMLLLLASIPYAIWAYIRVSLAMPAAVVEGLQTRAALRRSKALLVDRKVRIFLLLLLLLALYFVIGMVQGPLLFLIARSHGSPAVWLTASNLLVGFLAGALMAPVGAIGMCLFYIDERVRREGFDIEWMMTGSTAAPSPAAPAVGTASPSVDPACPSADPA